MTTSWPPAPEGIAWSGLDHLLGTTASLVGAESRLGGVHQVRWEPARRTRVAFDDAAGDTVVVEVADAGVARRHLCDDRALPGLATVLDPVHMARRLGPLLGEPVHRFTGTPVSYRPGSRCVVRGEVDTGSPSRTVYVKVLADDYDTYMEGHGAMVAAAIVRGVEPFVPVLLGGWRDLGAVVTLAAPGRSASSVFGDAAIPVAVRADLADRLGRLLAVLHGAEPGPVARGRLHAADDEVRGLERYLDAAWRADPATALSMMWLVDSLRAEVPGPQPLRLAHGSYRAGQVIVADDDHLTVLDLDGVGLADPARDLGNAMAHLDWQRVRTGIDSFSTAVEAGYRAGGDTIDRRALDWWRAAALVKIAGRRYRSLDTTTWSAIPALVRLASDLLDGGADTAASRTSSSVVRPPDVLDAERMSAVLQPLLAADGAAAAVVAAETLQVAGGRRIVVRYRTTATDPVRRDVVAKAYADPQRAVVTHENLVAFDSLTDPARRVVTPAPLGVLPERGIVLLASAPGAPVNELPTLAATDAARRLGTWLRAVHESPVQLRRVLDLDHEASNLRAWACEIDRLEPRLGAPARHLAELFATGVTRVSRVVDVPMHKDLHFGHVLVADGGAVTVIDLDEARMGDSALDVAHLVTNADEADPVATRPVVDAFLDGYGPLAGPDADGRYALFCAYTLVKITKQRVRRLAGTTASTTFIDEGLQRLERGRSWLAQ